MSLQDESFPTDELFEQLNKRGPRPAAFERNPSPFSDSYTDVANKSANTCVSDPVGRHEAEDEDEEEIENDAYDLHDGRSSKAVSCQDFHSAYTKRKYQHVTSKVAKYISDLNDQKKRSSTSGSIQRHSSMPEYLTPKSRACKGGHFSVDGLHQMDEEDSPKDCGVYEILRNEHEILRKENETIRNQKDRVQSYSDYLQERLDAKQSQFVQMKRNFETMRTELSDKNEKLKRHQRNSLLSLNAWAATGVTRATQTNNLKGNGIATPHPSFDLSYNISEGSEQALATGGSSVRREQNPNEPAMAIQPLSLNFTSVDARTADRRGAAAAAPNNSESSHPSSNDSAIDLDPHGLRIGLYYVDKRHDRFMEIQGVSLNSHSQDKLPSPYQNDESFPTDELFEQLNNRGPRPKFSELHQPAAFERNPAPFSDSYTDVANKSANTCVSDPVGRHEAEDEDEEEIENDAYDLHDGRSSKAVSCQDFHSAYTKRKYQHVTSKVAKYISDLNDQKKRSSTSGSIQRHSSMPEYLTPKSRARRGGGHFSVDELNQMEEEESPKEESKDSSCVDYDMLRNEIEMLRNENETIAKEKDRVQSYSDFLQERLDAKQSQFVQMKRNFETLRTELSDKDEKLKRHQTNMLRSLNAWPSEGVPKATQTDMVEQKGSGRAMPHPSFDLSYNTSEGSIEMALPTGESPVRREQNPGNKPAMVIQPLSLNFTSVDARTTARRGAAGAPNNSETSHPSSNDSAIDVENHGLRMGLYYVDKRHNRFTEIQGVSLDRHCQTKLLSRYQNVSDSQAPLLSQSQSPSQTQAHVRFRPRRISLGSRMLRIFGPCVSCSDHVQGQGQVQTLNVTYGSDLPLLEEELIAQRIQR